MTELGRSTDSLIPILVGLVVGIALIVVIGLALKQRARRARRDGHARAARPRCPSCGELLRAGVPHCLACGWAPPHPTGEVEFIYGPLEGQTFRLESTITTIGSQPGNTIVIPDPAVSRKHIGIRRDVVGYELADLGSTNGVYINGHRMAKRLLAAGDIIRIGASEMVFQLEKVG